MSYEELLVLAGHTLGPILIGLLCGRFFRRRISAGLIAAAIAWLFYLAFNLYSDAHSRDKELMHGSVLWFQITVGSGVALFSMACAIVTGVLSQRPNKSFKPNSLRESA